MPNIKYLQFDLKKDEKLPKSIGSLTNLTEIRLGFKTGADLKTSFENLARNKNIKVLTLCPEDDQDIILPSIIGKMVQLEKIKVTYLRNRAT